MEESTELDIGKYVRLIYKKRVLFVLIAMAITSAVVIASYLTPKVYEAKSIIFIERNFLNDLIKNVTITPSFEEKIKALSTVIKSRNLLLKVMGDLDLDLNSKSAEEIEYLLKDFQDKTEIKVEINQINRRDTDLFTVSYSGRDPKLASNYVNTLVRRYIEENLSQKREEAYGASRFLLEQINFFKDKLDRTEAEIARLKKDRGIVQNEQLLLAQKKLNELMVTYTEHYPEVVKIKTEIEQLKEQIKNSKTETARSRNAEPEKGAGSESIRGNDVPRFASDVPAGKNSLLNLERERDTSKKIYEELLTTLGKSQVSTQVEVQDKGGAFRILDPAVVPTKPVNPNTLRMILLGMLGGVGAALAVIIGLDLLDTSVRSLETLKQIGLPILAVIPTMQTAKEVSLARRKDRLLFTAAGLYLIGLLTIVAMEFMGLPYMDNLVQGTKMEIKSSVKNIIR